jgi:hypothetical protein
MKRRSHQSSCACFVGDECRKQLDERLKALATVFPTAGIIVIAKIEAAAV